MSRLVEWIFEAGIGESRAALIEDGRVVEAAIEVDGMAAHVGTVADARLMTVVFPGRRGVAVLNDGLELLIEPLPHAATEGATVRVEIVREAIAEPGNGKRPLARSANACSLREGPGLRARLAASGVRVVEATLHGPDLLELAGWTETLEAAASGEIAFDGGMLRIEPTAAMTVIDVDGYLAVEPLAIAAAGAVAAAIRRFGIAGSIGIDFPSVEGKAARLAVAAALDAALPPPFERTALNGFGFMQIVRPRLRPSLIEHLRADPVGHAARTLLRGAERCGIVGATRLVASPMVLAWIDANPDWTQRLARQLGGRVTLRADPALAMSAGHVERP